MSDVVSRLLAAIDERERLARAATSGPWRYNPRKEWHEPTALAFPPEMRPPGEEFVGAGPLDATVGVAATGPTGHPQSMADAAFIAANDPQDGLRLCQAHRDIVDEWAKRKQMADQLAAERYVGDAVIAAEAIVAALWAAVTLLARGYGVEDGEDHHGA